MWQISVNFENFNFGTNLCLTGGKYLIKIIFDIKLEIDIFDISNVPNFKKFFFNKTFNFETNLGLTGGKYFLKIIFDIKIEIVIFEI